jgi:hypothetical protein
MCCQTPHLRRSTRSPQGRNWRPEPPFSGHQSRRRRPISLESGCIWHPWFSVAILTANILRVRIVYTYTICFNSLLHTPTRVAEVLAGHEPAVPESQVADMRRYVEANRCPAKVRGTRLRPRLIEGDGREALLACRPSIAR